MVKELKTIQSILIANRGEIAVRIIKTARKMGIRSIAVFSEADKYAQHVKMADDAMLIGAAPVSQSYLLIENVIRAAKKSGADAIHPGYGLLSENAAFARACTEAEIIFIGPSSEAMEIMGNKAAAKLRMLESDVACVPGYSGEDQSDKKFASAAGEIGYPVMVKAASGGGGRGMRLVEKPGDLAAALEQARAEALSGFGSAELILEKLVTNARHIEFQVLGDSHGNIIHLGERDCSLQRRHQKVIEEAPSPALDEALRAEMGKVAVAAARSVSYEGAGTVEFLLDEGGDYYFLEMNTRLQVEHPVTEMITGIDLVEWQIRIARGEALTLSQDDVAIDGHAIEARLYAEDPASDFLPSTGRINLWIEPAGNNIRVDSGIVSGDKITPHYDAMVAKIIAHGNSREEARQALLAALDDTVLFGIRHNKDFLGELLRRKEFVSGSATTGLIDETYGEKNYSFPFPSVQDICLAASLDFIHARAVAQGSALSVDDTLLNWSSSPLPPLQFHYSCMDEEYAVLIHATGPDRFAVEFRDEKFDISISEDHNKAQVNGKNVTITAFLRTAGCCFLAVGGREFRFDDPVRAGQDDTAVRDGVITSPMHGNLVEVNVKTGEHVTADTSLATLEAMKMRHEIFAGVGGIVKEIYQQPGAQVAAGEQLFKIEVEETGDAAGE